MFVWWLIGSIGCLSMVIVYSDEYPHSLLSLEGNHVGDGQSESSNVDNPTDTGPNNTNHLTENEGTGTTSTATTTTTTPQPFACHQCTNCKSKSDLVSHPCESDIMMCYTMTKVLNNTEKSIRRGCSTSKSQCEVPHDDGSHTFATVTCCTSHHCNQAIHFKPWLFSSIFSLFAIIIHT